MNEVQSKLDQVDRKRIEADMLRLQQKVRDLITEQREHKSQIQSFE